MRYLNFWVTNVYLEIARGSIICTVRFVQDVFEWLSFSPKTLQTLRYIRGCELVLVTQFPSGKVSSQVPWKIPLDLRFKINFHLLWDSGKHRGSIIRLWDSCQFKKIGRDPLILKDSPLRYRSGSEVISIYPTTKNYFYIPMHSKKQSNTAKMCYLPGYHSTSLFKLIPQKLRYLDGR